MNSITESYITKNILTAKQLLTQCIKDGSLEDTYFATMLCPQWFAKQMGLKKLIEKDYIQEDDPYFLSITNV